MNDRYLKAVLTVIALLLAGNLWVSAQSRGITTAAPAIAQDGGIPNAGAQRRDMIVKLDEVADAVNDLARGLADGNVKVEVTNFPED